MGASGELIQTLITDNKHLRDRVVDLEDALMVSEDRRRVVEEDVVGRAVRELDILPKVSASPDLVPPHVMSTSPATHRACPASCIQSACSLALASWRGLTSGRVGQVHMLEDRLMQTERLVEEAARALVEEKERAWGRERAALRDRVARLEGDLQQAYITAGRLETELEYTRQKEATMGERLVEAREGMAAIRREVNHMRRGHNTSNDMSASSLAPLRPSCHI